jgi:hypothetical protein
VGVWQRLHQVLLDKLILARPTLGILPLLSSTRRFFREIRRVQLLPAARRKKADVKSPRKSLWQFCGVRDQRLALQARQFFALHFVERRDIE